MKTYKLSELAPSDRHQLILSAVAPRPIAFAGTIDENENINLSPFSFFNVFSTNPPVIIFSPSRRGFDGSMKHTHQNILKVPEVTISTVDYAMVQQMSLTSNEYPKDVNEFLKSGLTMMPSQLIRPPYVTESPAVFECRVQKVIELGKGPGSGNLIICEIDLMHVREEVLSSENHLDIQKLDLVGRMGGNWYVRASDSALFEVQKPSRDLAIGFDNLPQHLLTSELLTANELGILASAPALPAKKDIDDAAIEQIISEIVSTEDLSEGPTRRKIHLQIKKLIASKNVNNALRLACWFEEKTPE
jgi:flavin reductase (DIM6/NTAB) family NADH-FMN oxidoreductase RutF